MGTFVSYTVLDPTGLTAFIISAERINLCTQDHEGIFSFFCYLAIFVVGQAAAMHVLPRESKAPSTSSSSKLS